MKRKDECPFGFSDCWQVRMVAYHGGKHFICSGIAYKSDPAYDVIRICSKGSVIIEQQNWAVDEVIALIDVVSSSLLEFSDKMMPTELWRRKIAQCIPTKKKSTKKKTGRKK